LNLLAFDSSTAVGCVAAYCDGQIKAELTLSVRRTHSEHLMPAIGQVLDLAGFKPADLSAVGVGIGPGSYTGIRIAVGTAMGLGYALNLPVIPVPSLEIVAMGVWPAKMRVIALQPARKDEVYCGNYRCRPEPPYLEQLDELRVARLTEIPAILADQEAILVGSGAVLHQQALADILGPQARFAPPELAHPQPANLAVLCATKLALGLQTQAVQLKPLYLRRPYVD